MVNADHFREELLPYFDAFAHKLATDEGDWTVKGFIDVYRNIYTVSVDTKVVSKIIELMLYPMFVSFAIQHNYQMVLSGQQNHYPDVSFVAADGSKIALDLKSTYRTAPGLVNGFTLGAFTGYFRQRHSPKNVTFPYGQYAKHFVLGIIYSRADNVIDERQVHQLEQLQDITSVVRDFTFVLQEKWRIASDQPGSGNTKNIGSSRNIQSLIDGNGTFAAHGEQVFDDYWMNYLTNDMARAIDSSVPYRNIKGYLAWRSRSSSPTLL